MKGTEDMVFLEYQRFEVSAFAQRLGYERSGLPGSVLVGNRVVVETQRFNRVEFNTFKDF